MTLQLFMFYAFAIATLGAALGVITARNPVHASLYLVLTFVSTAALWILLQAEFLGMALILVYVGAVMVLFLFVVMMLDVNVDPLREGFARYLPVGMVVAGIMAFELVGLISIKYFGPNFASVPPLLPAEHDNTAEIGMLLFTKYVLPFELASVVLLVAAVAAIALTHRKRSGVKVQSPSLQVLVKKSDRLRIVSMVSEKPNVDAP